MDRAVFSSTSFDVTAWVNQACLACPSEEPIDKYLAELEMKVQLAAEDVEQQLYESSTLIIDRVAGATGEVTRLKTDVLSIGESVDTLATQVTADERGCSAAAAKLRDLDVVKDRMLAAKGTLEEATSLKQQYDSLNEVMDNGDMQQMLSVLSTMKNSMAALMKVPEFSGVSDKVTLLETRLKEMAAPQLAHAISNQNGEAMRQYWGTLAAVERTDLAQEVYVRHLGLKLQAAFQSASSHHSGPSVWLPGWHHSLLHIVSEENGWLSLQLPDQQPALFLQALSVSLKRFAAPLTEHLSTAQQSPSQTLQMLTTSLTATAHCCSELCSYFPDTDAAILSSLTHPLFQPFESFFRDYAQLEATVLASELENIPSSSSTSQAGTAAAEATVAGCLSAAPALQSGAIAALDRCASFTANLELVSLVPVLDTALEATLYRISATIEALVRSLLASSATNGPASGPSQLPELPQETLTQLLQLPVACASLKGCLAAIDTEVRTRAAALVAHARVLQDGSRGDGTVPDVVVWRLNSEGEVAKVLKWQQSAAAVLLPRAFAAWQALEGLVETTLLGALCAPSRAAMIEVEQMGSVWAEDAPPSGLHSFSPYPSSFSTTVGEYLMMLPPLLEVLVPEEASAEEQGTLATQWLDRVATAVAEELRGRVMAIQRLGSKGSLQLATDLEYVCNAITALGADLPPALATACTLSTIVLESDFKGMVAAGVADGSLDRHAVKVIARMRGIDVS